MKKLSVDQIARIIYETNRVYCEIIGDNSHPTWIEAPTWQKHSIVNGIRFARKKLKAEKDFDLAEIHAFWLEEKVKSGWVYGPVKDIERKVHPCIVPYNELPENQKIKDRIFLGLNLVFYNKFWKDGENE